MPKLSIADRLNAAIDEAHKCMTEMLEESGTDCAEEHAAEFLPDVVTSYLQGSPSSSLDDEDHPGHKYRFLMAAEEAMTDALAEAPEGKEREQCVKSLQGHLDCLSGVYDSAKFSAMPDLSLHKNRFDRTSRVGENLQAKDVSSAISRRNNLRIDAGNSRREAVLATREKNV